MVYYDVIALPYLVSWIKKIIQFGSFNKLTTFLLSEYTKIWRNCFESYFVFFFLFFQNSFSICGPSTCGGPHGMVKYSWIHCNMVSTMYFVAGFFLACTIFSTSLIIFLVFMAWYLSSDFADVFVAHLCILFVGIEL